MIHDATQTLFESSSSSQPSLSPEEIKASVPLFLFVAKNFCNTSVSNYLQLAKGVLSESKWMEIAGCYISNKYSTTNTDIVGTFAEFAWNIPMKDWIFLPNQFLCTGFFNPHFQDQYNKRSQNPNPKYNIQDFWTKDQLISTCDQFLLLEHFASFADYRPRFNWGFRGLLLSQMLKHSHLFPVIMTRFLRGWTPSLSSSNAVIEAWNMLDFSSFKEWDSLPPGYWYILIQAYKQCFPMGGGVSILQLLSKRLHDPSGNLIGKKWWTELSVMSSKDWEGLGKLHSCKAFKTLMKEKPTETIERFRNLKDYRYETIGAIIREMTQPKIEFETD